MVEQVTAFVASDGTLHKSKLAALEVDTINTLKQLDTFNHASALAIVKHCIEIHAVLGPLAEEAFRVAKEIERGQVQAEPV